LRVSNPSSAGEIVAYYLVRARPRKEPIVELARRLSAGEFLPMRPFGRALTKALEGANRDPATGEAVWEEEDYCSPPLAMERDAVLDRYFDGLKVEPVDRGEGWARVAHLPGLWEVRTDSSVRAWHPQSGFRSGRVLPGWGVPPCRGGP
jgi:hypothetical protein